LLVNDDGYEAKGIWSMQGALVSAGYEVVFVAPKRQQSWSGKSLFDHSPLTYEIMEVKGQIVHVLDATPAACVRIALHDIMEEPPLFVVSGINHGGNDGIQFMMSSGTLGAALEASLDGVRSIATSLAYAPGGYSQNTNDLDKAFKNAALVTVRIIKKLESYEFPDEIDALNLNVPYQIEEPSVAVCKPSRETYGRIYHRNSVDELFEKKLDSELFDTKISRKEHTDSYYLRKGQPSITPISLEIASEAGLSKLQQALEL